MGEEPRGLVNRIWKVIERQPRTIRMLIGDILVVIFVFLIVPFSPDEFDIIFYVIGIGIAILWAMFFWQDTPPDNPEV